MLCQLFYQIASQHTLEHDIRYHHVNGVGVPPSNLERFVSLRRFQNAISGPFQRIPHQAAYKRVSFHQKHCGTILQFLGCPGLEGARAKAVSSRVVSTIRGRSGACRTICCTVSTPRPSGNLSSSRMISILPSWRRAKPVASRSAYIKWNVRSNASEAGRLTSLEVLSHVSR